jgi:protein-S-isoprenylcysteine O-methyltransferase Ste14
MTPTPSTVERRNLPARSKIIRARIRYAVKYWLIIPGAVILGGKGLDTVFKLPSLPGHAALTAFACMLIAAGVLFIQKSTKDLSVYGSGTHSPLAPPKTLVTEGAYRLCRHPMFLGYDLAALGVILLFHSPGMLLCAYPVFLTLQWRFLKKEEMLLQRRFKEAFVAYTERTPFLLPTGVPKRKS